MFNSVGHFFASIFKGALSLAGIIAKEVPAVVTAVETPSPLLGGLSPLQAGEAIAAQINPKDTLIVNAGMALLGQFAALYSDGKAVLNGGFANFQLDAATFKIAEQAIPEVIAFFKHPTVNPVPKANG